MYRCIKVLIFLGRTNYSLSQHYFQEADMEVVL